MKKIISLVLSLMMLVCCFASCSSAKKDDEADKTGTNTEAKTEVTTAAKNDDSDSIASDDADYKYIKEKGKMIIGVTEYEPMNYKDSDGNWTGFDTEFAEAVCAKLGVEAEFFVIDWDNKFIELDSKAVDCIWNGMTITDEVKNNSSVTDAYVNNSQVVVMKSDHDKYTLENLSFAAESGSAGEAVLTEKDYDVTAVQTQADALLEVESGSVDACVIDITMARAMTGEGTSYADLTATESLQDEEYGISFRKDSGMTELVNSIMSDMKMDGSLKTLADKYQLTIAD